MNEIYFPILPRASLVLGAITVSDILSRMSFSEVLSV